MKLIIYLPALNEADAIEIVLAKLPRFLAGVDEIEILVVDDGSTDATAALALSAGAHVVSHGRNLGVGSAFQSAVEFVLENGADMLVSIDADGQFDPDEIPDLIQPIISKTADMVAGNRFAMGRPEFMSRLKYWGNMRMSQVIYFVSGQELQDVSSGFRAYNKDSLLRLNNFANFTYTHETILSLVFQRLHVMNVPVHVTYDLARKSRVANSILRYAMQTSRIILKVMLDYRPMRVFGSIAGFFVSIGSAFIVALFGYYFVVGNFTPYKSLGFIGLGFVIFGMLVLIIALIADMINRLRVNQDKLLYEMKKIKYGK